MSTWRKVPCFQILCLTFTLLTQWVLTVDVKPQQEVYMPDYSKYHNVTQVRAQLHQVASSYSDFIQINYGYSSRKQNPQLLTRITNFGYQRGIAEIPDFVDLSGNVAVSDTKVKILLSYGEHAREFFPVESFFHFLTNLTAGLSKEADSYAQNYSHTILSNFDIFVIVIANPDGRDYVESSLNYCWRGTSTGVDLNRNFDYQFGKKGSSGNPKDEEYRGPHPFSEPECNVYKDVTNNVEFDAFISFHSGIRHIYMPFADTESKAKRRDPPNFQRLSELSSRLSNSTKYEFRYGKAYDLNFYTADGTAFDYMAAVENIPFSLAIEMWDNPLHTGTSCFDEFNPESQHLMEELDAFHPMYVELFTYLLHWKKHQVVRKHISRSYFPLAVLLVLLMVLVYRCRHRLLGAKRHLVQLHRLGSMLLLKMSFR